MSSVFSFPGVHRLDNELIPHERPPDDSGSQSQPSSDSLRRSILSASLLSSHHSTATSFPPLSELPELLKDPQYAHLYRHWQESTQSRLEEASLTKKLIEENLRLRAEVEELKVNRVPDLPPPNLRIPSRSVSRSTSFRGSSGGGSSGSLGPSDSVSHAAAAAAPPLPQPLYQPATRPIQYPVEILWTFKDCKADPNTKMSKTNQSRPPMDKAVRNADGTMISSGEWSVIRSSVRSIKSELLGLPPPRDRRAKDQPQTKTYFRTWFPREWAAAVDKLEQMQPLLGLCAAHWKADRLLGSTLLVSAKIDGDDGDDADDIRSTVSSITSAITRAIDTTATTAKKRVPPSPPPKKSKKVKKDGETGAEKASHAENKSKQASLPASSVLSVVASVGEPPQPTKIDVSFIKIGPSVSNLQSLMACNYPSDLNAAALLKAIGANLGFTTGSPSQDVAAFLARIKTADPNSADLDEDDQNASWGHAQFTAGSLTSSSVLSSWSSVSNTEVARQLIAAVFRTCKVARHVCFVRGIRSESYLSNAYLANLTELLWKLWKDAGGPVPNDSTPRRRDKGKGKVPTKSPLAIADSATTLSLPESTAESPPRSSSDIDSQDGSAHEAINALTKDEMVQWLQAHSAAAAPSKSRSKDDFVKAILDLPKDQLPSKDDIDAVISKCKGKKVARRLVKG